MFRIYNLEKAQDYSYDYTSGEGPRGSARGTQKIITILEQHYKQQVLNYQYPRENLKGFTNGLPKVKAWHLSFSNSGRDPDIQMIPWNHGRQEY